MPSANPRQNHHVFSLDGLPGSISAVSLQRTCKEMVISVQNVAHRIRLLRFNQAGENVSFSYAKGYATQLAAVLGARWRYTCNKPSDQKHCESPLMAVDVTQTLRIDPADLPDESVIFGRTAAMREIRSRIDRVLSTDVPVLIQGDSGTGKEVIARYLHTRSNRCEAPFVKMNCAAVPANLLESELFGYQKGSFTGAKEDRPGLIEIADGGTLFLDEIGELHRDLQGKLLHLLQDGSFTRIGGSEERVAHIRVICATNTDLKRAMEERAFREDLFYRIEVVTLRMPVLRDRKDDIPLLCDYFLERLARKFSRTAPQLDAATLHLLSQWDWPGNLRELENWVARAIILGDSEALGAELKRRLGLTNYLDNQRPRTGRLKESSRRAASTVTSALILKVLQANRWNRRKTAEDLNMSYRSLLYKLREAGIPQRRRSHRGFPPGEH
jgi:two-component system, NtrC family, response regulator AtoC